MRLAAEPAVHESTRSKKPQYEKALSGLLRARILGEPKEERKQFEILEQCEPDRLRISPPKPVVRHFVNRDYHGLAKAVADGAARHWSDAYLGRNSRDPRVRPVVVKEERGRLILNLANKSGRFFWPYPEAVFAKLAMMDGATISYDDFWFPLTLVKAMTPPAPGNTLHRASSVIEGRAT
jgi:hypothetical protein